MFELITNARVYAPESLGLRHLLVCAGKIVHLAEQVPKLDDAQAQALKNGAAWTIGVQHQVYSYDLAVDGATRDSLLQDLD